MTKTRTFLIWGTVLALACLLAISLPKVQWWAAMLKTGPLSIHVEHDSDDRPTVIYTYYNTANGVEVKHGMSYVYYWGSRTREVHYYVDGESTRSEVNSFDVKTK